MKNLEHKEGAITKSIENQTAKLPSDTYLIGAGIAVAISLTLKLMDKKAEALFVGQWVAPILLLGVYNKLVKQLGSD
jgi:cbb3-type cytochrome oxidase subunit 1